MATLRAIGKRFDYHHVAITRLLQKFDETKTSDNKQRSYMNLYPGRIPTCKILKKKKKKWTHPRFLHRGPKKAVEQDSDVHFDLT